MYINLPWLPTYAAEMRNLEICKLIPKISDQKCARNSTTIQFRYDQHNVPCIISTQ
jgi:hypothetical protein